MEWLTLASAGVILSAGIATVILIMIGVRYGTKTFGKGLISSLIKLIFINTVLITMFMLFDILAAYYRYAYLYAVRGVILYAIPLINLYGMLLVRKYAKEILEGVEGHT